MSLHNSHSTISPPSVLPDISPSRGEISQSQAVEHLISPLERGMSGRTEGGAQGRNPVNEWASNR